MYGLPTIANISRVLVLIALMALPAGQTLAQNSEMADADIAALEQMIHDRETAMIDHDVEAALAQFAENATWVNSQGYYFVGLDSVREFHRYLTQNEERDYEYIAGEPLVRLLDDANAVVYYGWRMIWHEPGDRDTVITDEIGIMTLTAQKRDGAWKWVAVTVQHTPYFYEIIEPITRIGD
jgi:uncharacterized protein (TIGR02246 family)